MRDFSYCPKDGFPRIIRFVSASEFEAGVMSMYDAARNVLTINREAFNKLDSAQQREVQVTQETTLFFQQA